MGCQPGPPPGPLVNWERGPDEREVWRLYDGAALMASIVQGLRGDWLAHTVSDQARLVRACSSRDLALAKAWCEREVAMAPLDLLS